VRNDENVSKVCAYRFIWLDLASGAYLALAKRSSRTKVYPMLSSDVEISRDASLM
jgi:hypothetical protein